MIMKKFKQMPMKKKAKTVLLYAFMPFAWLIDSAVKVATYLFSRRKAVLSCMLAVAMLLTVVPLYGLPVSAAITYNATYTGSRGTINLSSGNYLLNNVTITVPAGQNGISIASGATVTLYISGTATISVGKYTWSVYARGGFAGILVPSGSTLIVKKADDASTANLNVTGGNGADAERAGAGGGGAAIGTNGGDGGISNDTDGANGGNGSSAGAIGTINLSNEVQVSLKGGTGGQAKGGTTGGEAYTGRDGNGKVAKGGDGGDGGGGSGYNGASLGTGGGGGGAGGAGGKGSFDRWDMWAECSGGGGGGGGQGPVYGGGGGGGGASAANNGGQSHSEYRFSGGSAGYSGYPTTAEKVSTHAAFSKERWATSGTGGQGGYNPDTDKKALIPGLGGAAGTTRDSGGELGGNGGNGGLAGKAAIEYTCIEFIDAYRNVTSYKAVVSGSAIGAFPSAPANTHYTFEGWYNGSTKVDETVKVSGNVYTLKAKWTELPHNFSYTASGNTVVAKCTLDGCEYSTDGVTLSIDANACNKVYDGKVCASAKVTNGITSVTGATAGKVFYVSTDGAGYNSAFVPKNTGAYKAIVTIGRVTAYQNFVITKATLYVVPSSHTVNMLDPLPVVQTSYSGFVNGETQSTAGITGEVPNIKFYTDSTKITEMTSANVPGNHVIAYDDTGTLQAKNYSFKYMTGTLTVGSIYEISTAEQFLTFAQTVNDGATTVNAVLKNDIDLSSVCSKLSGKSWTPVGTGINPYAGNFDGNGFTVSGLYINSIKDEQALFGVVSGGAFLHDVILADNCAVTGGNYTAGLVGGSIGGGQITIENCGNNATVVGGINTAGIFGVNMGSKATITMTNCYNTGAITATKEGGGLSGWLGNAPTIVSCYSTGVVTNGDAFARSNNNDATVESSYVLDTLSTTFPVTAQKTAEMFANGEVTYLLNGGVTDGSQSWYQKLGENGDAIPLLTENVAQKTVYQVKEYLSCSLSAGYSLVYRNTPDDITHSHQFDVNGVCTVCGEADPDYMIAVNGVYQIATPGQLLWFSAYVNMGNNDASACLIADIDMNTYKWTGLINYSGTFDGQNNTISNLCRNAGMGDTVKWGLTSSLQTGGVIRNLNIVGADVFHNTSGGGGVIAGNSSGLIENVLVTNCTLQFGAYNWFGGIAGINRGVIRNCGVVSTVIMRRYNGVGKSLGGITDVNNGTVENCFSYNNAYRNGSATAMGALIVGGNAPKNCYYSTNSAYVPNTFNENIEKTAAQFSSGEITSLLNNGVTDGSQVWYQTVGTGYPLLEGKTVYSGYDSCGNTEMVYSNISLLDTLPEHQYSDWKDNGDGTHSRVCSKCGDKQTFSHSDDPWTDNGDGTHSRTCSACKSVQTEGHVDDNGDMICDLCGEDLTIISVEITWGSMEFTYTDASEGTWNATKCEYENSSSPQWTCDADANKITVTSESNVELKVSFRYEATVGVKVEGSFVDEEDPITEAIPVDKGDKTPQMTAVWLKLDGRPEENASNAVMGTATVTIGG